MHQDAPLAIEPREGRAEGTRIFYVTGPITLGENLFVFQDALRTGNLPRLAILDLSQVPYIDSAGLGAIVDYFVHCHCRGSEMRVAGVNSRAMELFILTKLHTVIPMRATVEEAEVHVRETDPNQAGFSFPCP